MNMIMINAKHIAFLLAFLVNGLLYASHASGGQITYVPTGNPNEYIITATHYRDCSGIPAPQDIHLDITNTCGFNSTFAILPLYFSTEISQLCPAALPSSTCNNGALPGMEEYIYKDTIVLSGQCNSWTLAYRICVRNPSINLDIDDCLYVETSLNNAQYPYNTSPYIIRPYQIRYVCNNVSTTIALGVIDPDQNLLKYRFGYPMADVGYLIGYNPGFTNTNPIPGITLDSLTGDLQFTPTLLGNFVIVILIDEYDLFGNLIGTVTHDFQIIVEDCMNTPPVAASSVSNFNGFGTNASISGNVISMCDGGQFCFDFTFSDPDVLDLVSLSSDIQTKFPGSTFIQTGTNPATAQVCMVAQPSNPNLSFTINAIDNSCPLIGSASQTFQLSPIQNIGLVNNTYYVCNSSSPVTYLGNPDIYWMSLTGDTLDIGTDVSCNPCANPSFLFNTDTTILAQATSITCVNTDTLTIVQGNPSSSFASDTVYVCSGDSIIFYAPDPTIFNIWNGTIIQDSLIFSPSGLAIVNLQSIANGCSSNSSSTVLVDLIDTPIVHIGQGGLYTGNYVTYQWYYNNIALPGETNQNVVPASNGYYQVEVTNNNGCVAISDYFTVTTADLQDVNNEIKMFRQGGFINISTSGTGELCLIYDLSGRLIIKQLLSPGLNQVNIKDNQVYLIQIIRPEGAIYSKKL